MYVELFVAEKVWGIDAIKEQIERDFNGTYELKFVDGGVQVSGECGLMTNSENKDWSFSYNVKDEKLDYLIYFECGKDMSWMVTPICRMMQTDNKSRAFSGSQINDMIRWMLSCLSGLKWEPKIKEEEKK